MLGHIHKHQQWERVHDDRVQRIAYAGSCGRFHYGEDGEKYALEWHVTAGAAEFVAHVTPSKRMIDIEFDGVPDLEQLAGVAHACRDSWVRVRYSVDEAFRALATTPIPYNRVGLASAFWLYKNKTRVGTCRTELKGIVNGRRSYHAFLSVMEGTPEKDLVALENWAAYASNELAGTLLRDLDFTWESSIELALAA